MKRQYDVGLRLQMKKVELIKLLKNHKEKGSTEVLKFLSALEHPFKQEIEQLRTFLPTL